MVQGKKYRPKYCALARAMGVNLNSRYCVPASLEASPSSPERYRGVGQLLRARPGRHQPGCPPPRRYLRHGIQNTRIIAQCIAAIGEVLLELRQPLVAGCLLLLQGIVGNTLSVAGVSPNGRTERANVDRLDQRVADAFSFFGVGDCGL